jgi:hypothetical protein
MVNSLARLRQSNAWLFSLTLLYVAPPVAFSQTKQDLPDPTAQDKALALVREVFQEDFAAAQSDEEKQALARKMIQQAAGLRANTADAYVMLRVARDIAVQSGSIQIAATAINKLSDTFEFDELNMAITAARGVAKHAKSKPDRAALAEFALPLVERAIASDQFQRAADLAHAVAESARRANEFAVSRALSDRAMQAESLAAKYKLVAVAVATLESQPDDPEANEVVGRFTCFVKRDWGTGLSYLALCSDPTLKQLAASDLAEPTEVKACIAVADGWWRFAEKQTGTTKDNVLRRAGYWYRKAQPAATGLLSTKIKTRLAQVSEAVARADKSTGPGNTSKPKDDGWTTVFRSANPAIWNNDFKKGNEVSRSTAGLSNEIKFLRMTMLAKTPRHIIIPMRKDQLNRYWEQGTYGWNGTSQRTWSGRHLGVFVKTRTNARGAIHVGNYYPGWGFGHVHYGAEQGYSWHGQRVAPIAFEIAVKNSELTKSETKWLLR